MLIFDFKSGVTHPTAELQLAAYIYLVKEGIGEDGKRFMDRENKTDFEVRLYHPLYGYAGTVDMVIDDGKQSVEGLILYLKDNGKYSLKSIKNIRINFETFLCFLRTEKWKKEHRLEDVRQVEDKP